MKRKTSWAFLCGLGLCVALSGCNVVDEATGANDSNVGQSMTQKSGKLSRKELSQKLRRLAMSYLGEVPEACEKIAADNPSLEQRLLALRIRVSSTDSVISIAADPDPQVSLLNMVTILTLQRMLAEQRGEEFFGEQAPLYVNAARRMEKEVWTLAGQVLDESGRDQLRKLITEYRRDNPDEVYVWWVRFSEFSAYQERFSIASVGQGFVDVFVPVGSAVSGIESTTDVAERATWLAARQAMIIQWRIELTYLQALSAPETNRLLSDIERVAETVDALPDRLANERKQIIKAVEDQEVALSKLIAQTKDAISETKATVGEANKVVGRVDQTIKTAGQTVGAVQSAIQQADQSIANAKEVLPQTESTLAQLETTSTSLNKTVQAVEGLMRQFESDPDAPAGRPFDITEYTQAARELGTSVEHLNALVSNIDQSAQPTRLDATLDTLEGRASALIWQAGFAVVLAGLILILAAKLIPRRRRQPLPG